jgi:hypothetical protein
MSERELSINSMSPLRRKRLAEDKSSNGTVSKIGILESAANTWSPSVNEQTTRQARIFDDEWTSTHKSNLITIYKTELNTNTNAANIK